MGAFGISAVRTLACALAAVVALTACGSGTSKTAATNAMTDNEGVYLDTVKGRSGPGWSSWPSDAVLIEQGHQICERLRAGAMPRAVVFTSPAIFSSSLKSDQVDWQVYSARVTLC